MQSITFGMGPSDTLPRDSINVSNCTAKYNLQKYTLLCVKVPKKFAYNGRFVWEFCTAWRIFW